MRIRWQLWIQAGPSTRKHNRKRKGRMLFLSLAGCSETGKRVGSYCLFLGPCLISGSGQGGMFSIVGSLSPHTSPARWAWQPLQDGTMHCATWVGREGPFFLLLSPSFPPVRLHWARR